MAPHLPGKSRGWRSLVGCSPWGWEESATTEQLHFHFSLSCFGEGNGNPLHCNCLENPRDGGAWWAAVYGVAQSQTGLKRRSSSSRQFRNGIYNNDSNSCYCIRIILILSNVLSNISEIYLIYFYIQNVDIAAIQESVGRSHMWCS